jgi:hypothetical protein
MRASSCVDKCLIISKLETFLLGELTSTIMACLNVVFSSESFKRNETENCSINTCLESSVKFLTPELFLIVLEISIPVRVLLTWELTYLYVHKKLILVRKDRGWVALIKACSLDRQTSCKLLSLTVPVAALPSRCLAKSYLYLETDRDERAYRLG